MLAFIRNNKFNFLIVFLLLFISIFIRKNIIFSGMLFEDDLISTVKSIYGDVIYESSQFVGWYLYSKINYLLSELVYIRLVYIVLIVTNLMLLANILMQIAPHLNKKIILLSVIFAGVNPYTVEMSNFVMGSYPVIGLFFGLFGLSLSNYVMYSIKTNKTNYVKIVGLVLLIAALYFASFQSANLMYLFPLILFPIHYSVLRNLRDDKFQFIWLIIIVVLPYIILYVYSTFYNASNHYNDIKGWTSYSVLNWIRQIRHLISNTFSIYIHSLGSIDFSTIFISSIIAFMFSNKRIENDIRLSAHKHLMFILIIFTILTIAAYLVVTRIETRYIYVASLFAYIYLFIAIYEAVSKHKFLKNYLSLIVFILFTINIDAYLYLQEKKYDAPSVKQAKLINHVKKLSSEWEPNSQVVFLLDESIPSFTYGFNHWSTWFLRYHTKDRLINGVIGTKEQMKHYPFVDKYKDHDKFYWYTTGKNEKLKSARKRMVGLVKSKPTYIYKIADNGNVQKIDYIVIKSDFKYSIYTANTNGIVLYNSDISLKEFSEFDSKNNNNYIMYDLSSSLFVIPGVNYEGGYEEFHLENYKTQKNNSKITGSYELSFSLKTNETDIASIYNKQNPPMPIIFKPLVMYQIKNDRYKIFIGKHNVEFNIDPDKWYKLNLFSDKLHGITSVKINGIEILHIKEYFSLSDTYQLGKGYNERYWNGKISSIVINNK